MQNARTKRGAQAKAQARDFRPMAVWGLMILTFLILVGCERREDRISFDDNYYRAKLKREDRKQRDVFTISVSPVSASLDGAREAGRYEGTRYCIENYGTSLIDWAQSPDADEAELVIDKDTLLLAGRCSPE